MVEKKARLARSALSNSDCTDSASTLPGTPLVRRVGHPVAPDLVVQVEEHRRPPPGPLRMGANAWFRPEQPV